MAVDYDVFVANDIGSDSLLRIVEDALGVDHFRDPECRSEHCPSLVGRSVPGLILTASAMTPMGAEIREEWLGFRPEVSAGFRWDKEEAWPTAFCRILRATSAVLANVSGNAALIANGERGLLIRRDGRVVVSDEVRTFHPEALAEIRVPYEFGRVPSDGDAP